MQERPEVLRQSEKEACENTHNFLDMLFYTEYFQPKWFSTAL